MADRLVVATAGTRVPVDRHAVTSEAILNPKHLKVC
jgi:hypothetical protein